MKILLEGGIDSILQHERKMLSVFHSALKDPARYSWYGADRVIADKRCEGRVGLVGINLAGFAPPETAAILDEQFDIAVRAGLHCAPYAHKHLGTFPHGTVRLSVGLLTTAEEMREAAAAFDEIAASA